MGNRMLEQFKEGKKTMGTFTHLGSSVAVEAIGYGGADYVIIDREHSPVGIESVVEYAAAAQLAGMTPLLRISDITRGSVLTLLDAGIQGLVIPYIRTPEQVKAAVEFGKYAPVGSRGYCATRDGGWGYAPHAENGLERYMRACNQQTLLLPQCETAECLGCIEEIAALDGVDGIFVGPFDLSISLGRPGQFDDREFMAAVERILKACKGQGKLAVIFASTPALARRFFAMGYDSVTLGLDVGTLIEAYREQFRACVE